MHPASILHSPSDGEAAPLRVADMGCGKGYLTFATAALFGGRARVEGIEARADLVGFCNRVAGEHGFANLTFTQGTIAAAAPAQLDILIALHACDTATDDAIAKGVAAGARLIVVSPCCHKELRPQLVAPPLLAGALRHGIFQERQAEFVTDALRAQLLEWSGYRVKVFEFISTGHTAKNLMIAAVKPRAAEHRAAAAERCAAADDELARRIRALAAAYGVRRQSLAAQLGFALA
ncbi:MAG: SAM-dependent methyltransferase [Opitutaceae bacterium]|nr:SAM-dependent methyltransferase [Opitutaceae bacterium]